MAGGKDKGLHLPFARGSEFRWAAGNAAAPQRLFRLYRSKRHSGRGGLALAPGCNDRQLQRRRVRSEYRHFTDHATVGAPPVNSARSPGAKGDE